jgi:uncharacterized SAM-binding protein YcdF (DUF218 family)
MFALLKILKPFFLPIGAIFLFLVVALIALKRSRQRPAFIIITVVTACLYGLSTEPVAYALIATLERFPDVAIETLVEPENIDAIVVLAGGASSVEGKRPFGELAGVSSRRLWRAIDLYHALDGAVPLLYSGGSGDPFQVISHEAALAKKQALTMGVYLEHIFLEDTARNTAESGSAVARMLNEHTEDGSLRIILVTSAWHMPRAAAVMEAAQMEVIPAPADMRSGALQIDPLSFVPTVDALSLSTLAIHEWIGFIGYRLLGLII